MNFKLGEIAYLFLTSTPFFGDIVLLADHFLKKAAEEDGKNIEGFSLDVLNKMENYHWPGNIRELEI